ncbi:MAG TPA: hypothetical protein VKP65_13485 [Rhodothermales bacterium]|nr:hypothetical protein [Rhodothermales bacterium]
MKSVSPFALLVLCIFFAATAQAQPRTAGEWAWKPILDHAGVSFSYIFYQHADNHHNGVVLKLVNTNDYDVTYRFKIIFRSEGEAVVEPVSGSLRAREIKTGDAEGLFWIPFKDGREIAEVGLRGYKVVPKESSGSRAAQNDDP